MGELLFRVGEDKMMFGSDYAIWEPKWEVEGFVDWDYPDSDDFSDYPRLDVNGKKKIMGLNAARLYDIEVPPEFQIADHTARRDAAVAVAESKAEVVG
jgi:predicted TIM-barrel fold metal-dependent hydrolase